MITSVIIAIIALTAIVLFIAGAVLSTSDKQMPKDEERLHQRQQHHDD